MYKFQGGVRGGDIEVGLGIDEIYLEKCWQLLKLGEGQITVHYTIISFLKYAWKLLL